MVMLIILALALAVDLTLGELPAFIHPVVWMGKVVSVLEAPGEKGRPSFQFVYGAVLTLFMIWLFAMAGYFVLNYLKSFSTVAYVVVAVALWKSSFSLGELRKAALRVKNSLLNNKLDGARYELRSLVSRDTSMMTEHQAVSAAVESVAENICDSFVAPLLYFLLFGVPGALAYRVVNTLDAMIGYHGKYEYLGKFAAKLDDVLNFIPARLSGLLLVLAAFITGRGFKPAWQGLMAEHSRTESPNAGWTMAAAAGALNVRLEKVGHYQLGKAGSPLVPRTIDASIQLVMLAALIWAVICFAAGGLRFAITT